MWSTASTRSRRYGASLARRAGALAERTASRTRPVRSRVDARTTCPACHADGLRDAGPYLNTGAHAHEHFARLRCYRCGSCGTGWSDAPSEAALADYYGTTYEPAQMQGVRDDRWPLWDVRAATLLTLGRLFGEFDDGELFVDVGPGNGAALGLANWLLPKPRLAAVEYNQASIAYFRRHMPAITITQSLSDIGTAAMVYSSHSLEHVRPAALDDEVAQVARKLRPGGVFVVEVPLGSTSMASRHTPHLLFFSLAGLRALLTRHGFEVPLALVAEGRMKSAGERIDARYRSDMPALIARLGALRAGDLVPAQRPYRRGNTIKAFAVRR